MNKIERENSKLKYLIMIICCLTPFGAYYILDNVGVTYDTLKKQFEKKYTEKKFDFYFSLLYSIYSFPNIILPLLGGILILKIGFYNCYLLFSLLILIGQIIIVIGLSKTNMIIMLIGRFIFGLGGENINTVQSIIIINWFNKNSLSFPLAFLFSVAKSATVLNDIISPRIIEDDKADNAFILGMFFCFFSLIFTIVLVVVDKKYCIYEEKKNENNNYENMNYKSINNINNNENNFENNEENNENEKLFVNLFWTLTIYGFLFYLNFFPFNNISANYYKKEFYNDDEDKKSRTGFLMGIPGLIALFFSPFIGKFTDEYGKKMIILLISSILSSLAFFSFLYLNLLLPSIIILGISYSLFTSVYWPSMTMTIINKKKISFVIGLNFSFLNFAASVGPLIITKIKNDYNYNKVIFYLIIVNFVNIFVGIFGYFHDIKKYGLLNKRKKDKNSNNFIDNSDINIKNIPLYNEEINEKDNFDNVKKISLISK